jgi:hypothetical protein
MPSKRQQGALVDLGPVLGIIFTRCPHCGQFLNRFTVHAGLWMLREHCSGCQAVWDIEVDGTPAKQGIPSKPQTIGARYLLHSRGQSKNQ